MYNSKIGFKFAKHFFKSNIYLGRIYWQNAKSDLFSNKCTFTFNDTGLDTQRSDKKINYNYITQSKDLVYKWFVDISINKYFF